MSYTILCTVIERSWIFEETTQHILYHGKEFFFKKRIRKPIAKVHQMIIIDEYDFDYPTSLLTD